MIVDIEKLVAGYLRDNTEVSALGPRIVGKTPREVADPWVRVTLLDAAAAATSKAEHLIGYLVQLDCYAGVDREGELHGQPEANLLGRTVRAALHAMPGVHDGAVVSSVRFTGMVRLSDAAFEPARERVVLDATIHAHG